MNNKNSEKTKKYFTKEEFVELSNEICTPKYIEQFKEKSISPKIFFETEN